jgi:hypothetical protein
MSVQGKLSRLMLHEADEGIQFVTHCNAKPDSNMAMQFRRFQQHGIDIDALK